jgi:hypothetical protein
VVLVVGDLDVGVGIDVGHRAPGLPFSLPGVFFIIALLAPGEPFRAQLRLGEAGERKASMSAWRCPRFAARLMAAPSGALALRDGVNIASPARKLRNYPHVQALREAGMDRDVLDTIEREINEEVRG